MKERTISILCSLLILWMASLPCSAQDTSPQPPPPQDNKAVLESTLQAPPPQDSKAAPEEVSISADRMEMQMEGNTIELSGNVLIYDSTMNLTAEKMTVFLDKDNRLERVEALNNVTIRKLNGSESATGERGSYDSINELITLEGNCTLLQGKNVLSCSEIIYDRKKQTITAKGASLNIRDLKNRGTDNIDFLKLKNEENTPEEKK
ncbi:MAG: lipopolysaccharide transport periplasmic protein LptA [Lentisphaeria bacterium]